MDTVIDLTTDLLEQRLMNGETAIARVRAAQMTIIHEIDRRQTPLADGCRSTVEWVTGRLDVTPETATNGGAGVVVEAGPRAGPDTIEAILCNAVIEVTGRTEDGTPLGMGHRTRTIPPRLRRYVLHRDGAVCTIEGCISRYRLQTHHITPWSQGGPTNADNLTTLCWFHHHIVIHGRGYTINPSTPPQRRRLNKPPIHAPPG